MGTGLSVSVECAGSQEGTPLATGAAAAKGLWSLQGEAVAWRV